ncbi:unnamed protein product [Paramecium sonneborni]|uniref:Uncharacterized protein n=1 Tax=Paramecium sonneborni TaxID=65129 RepID=A0A8S1RB96_9CILI|nr:unnamed protein product [Paramecium sonneborni]
MYGQSRQLENNQQIKKSYGLWQRVKALPQTKIFFQYSPQKEHINYLTTVYQNVMQKINIYLRKKLSYQQLQNQYNQIVFQMLQCYRSGWVFEKVARISMNKVKYINAEKALKGMKQIEPNHLEGMDYQSCLWHLKQIIRIDILYLFMFINQYAKSETSLRKKKDNSTFGRAIQLNKDQDQSYANTFQIMSFHQIQNLISKESL